MFRVVLAELRHRRGRVLALLSGIAVATASFTVLTGASESSRLEVRGTVNRKFRTAYDVLVRPQRSRTGIEARDGLVEANFLSGLFGGISMRQYREVADLPGVEVAAPLAVFGYATLPAEVPVALSSAVRGRRSVFRVLTTWHADGGRTQIVDPPSYVYATRGVLRYPTEVRGAEAPGLSARTFETLGDAQSPRRGICADDLGALPAESPWARSARQQLTCWSTRTGLYGRARFDPAPRWQPRRLGATVTVPFPLLVAGIDPVAEARLTGVDQAITDGRYLRAADRPRSTRDASVGLGRRDLPILIANRPYLDLRAGVTVERLPGAGDRPLRVPAAGRLTRALDAAPTGPKVASASISAASAYGDLLRQLRQHGQEIDGYWTTGPLSYRRRPGGLRALRSQDQPLEFLSGYNTYAPAPVTSGDISLRQIKQHLGDNSAQHAVPRLRAVGTFDPSAVPNGASTALSSYTEPSAALPGGGRLVADGNLAGYLAPPPLALTTLAGAGFFGDTAFFGSSQGVRSAPISTIRVRVRGVTGADPVSRERVRLVAQRIAQSTGLDVDITAGASPTNVRVELPAGRYGRPVLDVSEPWIKKGVAVAVLKALDRKSVALFLLVLAVCALFCVNAVSAAVRGRSVELGMLACLGWPRRHLFGLVLAEVAVVGVLAGALGLLLALPVGGLFALPVSGARALAAIPCALLLALAAGLQPAWRAARSTPAAAVRPPVATASRARSARTISGMALTNLLRVPGRAVLAATSLAVGFFALTMLLSISLGFRGAVVGSVLGDAVAVQTRGADFVAVIAAITLGGLAVADVLYLNLRDRAGELATLRATGWDEANLRRLVAVEGLGIGAAGATVGVALGLLSALLVFGAQPPALLLLLPAAAISGSLMGVAASAAPVRLLARLPTAMLLAEE